jgi:methyl acetate hydrolase
MRADPGEEGIMIELSRRTVMLGAAATVVAGVTRGAHAEAVDSKASLDRAFAQMVASKRVPGIVALSATDEKPIYQGAFGKRSLAQDAAMTPDSVFWIASMTKAITSTAAMQMVEQGKLSLDGPISDVLPELKSVQVLDGFDASGQPLLRAPKRPITLRQLLTHTAGFTYDIFDANTGRYEKLSGLPGIISCKNDALRTPLAFDPGERWEYGINIDWAGKAVERVSGQKLGAYFQDHLFSPLGMTDTSFKLSSSQRARLVQMHARQPEGSLKPIDFEIPQEPEFEMGGGGLYSTAPDYMKFCQVFLHAGRSGSGTQVLRSETVAEMSKNQMGDLNVTAIKSADPASSRDAEFFPGMVKKWSTAFMINTADAPTGRSAGSLAWAGLGNTYFWIDPKRRVAGVILMQLLPFGDPDALDAFSQFERATYEALQSA